MGIIKLLIEESSYCFNCKNSVFTLVPGWLGEITTNNEQLNSKTWLLNKGNYGAGITAA